MDVSPSQKNSLDFLHHHFQSYYRVAPVDLPDRFSRREFAFVFFGGRGMLRHLSFSKKQALYDFVGTRAPAHAYYSTAYYQTPDARTMQEKGWMGAELIFDLDADHLPNADVIPYHQQLSLVKKEFYKLVDDFLLKDFGFEESSLELYFSGGRGYHCHVKDPKILHLDSGERREIVDYIIGRDFSDSVVFFDHSTGVTKIGSQQYSSGKSLTMPSPDEPGWRGRISRGLIELIEDIIQSDDPIKKLKEYGVASATAERLVADFSSDRINRIKQGKLDQSKAIRRFFLNNILRKTAVSYASGETDEPVTCDTKRLIRLPGSLHGKTGLKVTAVTLDTLKEFDPLQDAIAFSDESIQIEMLQKNEVFFNNKTFDLEEGMQEVPLYLAIFLIGRKMAQISSK